MKWFIIAVVIAAVGWNIFSQQQTLAEAKNIDFSNAVILDVLTPQEFASGHVNGAINIPSTVITKEKVADVLTTDQVVVLYCRSGARASGVQSRMAQWGYSDVINLRTQGGVEQAMMAAGQ